jgi:aspartate/methionine/tyrosine aminotransferase
VLYIVVSKSTTLSLFQLQKMSLDTYYCLEFLRQKGVCVVPGSGFGKLDGRWHFRYSEVATLCGLLVLTVGGALLTLGYL